MMIYCESFNSVYDEKAFPSISETTKSRLGETVEKIKKAVLSPAGILTIGFAIGLALPFITVPLTLKIITPIMSHLEGLPDPFISMSYLEKICFVPYACIVAPVVEEYFFRGLLQEKLKTFFSYFTPQSLSPKIANTLTKILAIFCSSVVFGLAHLSNALSFGITPLAFVPQVVSATIGGIMLGIAKEVSGELPLPTSMHIGNNCLSCAQLFMMS